MISTCLCILLLIFFCSAQNKSESQFAVKKKPVGVGNQVTTETKQKIITTDLLPVAHHCVLRTNHHTIIVGMSVCDFSKKIIQRYDSFLQLGVMAKKETYCLYDWRSSQCRLLFAHYEPCYICSLSPPMSPVIFAPHPLAYNVFKYFVYKGLCSLTSTRQFIF